MNPTDVVRASVDTWNNADRQGFLACYAEDCEIVTPALDGKGHDGVAAFWTSIMGPMPDCRVQVLRLLTEGDAVAEEALSQATNTGPSYAPDGTEIPATGRTATFAFSALHTVQDDKIVSSHFYWDTLAILAQLGLLPDANAG